MSNRGFLVFAAGEKYVKQAYLLALSIKKNSIYPISIVTNDRVPYTIFDNIIPHTFNASGRFVTDVRKHAYDLTPYSETIVLDTDTIVLQNLDYFWNIKKNSFYYTTNAFTYRNELITSDYYRKTFTANNLPNCYNAFYYFKKDFMN